MNLTATEATERYWCNFCPDLILPGEMDATGPNLKNPFGEEGHAHADCARSRGHEVASIAEPTDADAALRAAFREGVRVRGGPDMDHG